MNKHKSILLLTTLIIGHTHTASLVNYARNAFARNPNLLQQAGNLGRSNNGLVTGRANFSSFAPARTSLVPRQPMGGQGSQQSQTLGQSFAQRFSNFARSAKKSAPTLMKAGALVGGAVLTKEALNQWNAGRPEREQRAEELRRIRQEEEKQRQEKIARAKEQQLKEEEKVSKYNESIQKAFGTKIGNRDQLITFLQNRDIKKIESSIKTGLYSADEMARVIAEDPYVAYKLFSSYNGRKIATMLVQNNIENAPILLNAYKNASVRWRNYPRNMASEDKSKGYIAEDFFDEEDSGTFINTVLTSGNQEAIELLGDLFITASQSKHNYYGDKLAGQAISIALRSNNVNLKKEILSDLAKRYDSYYKNKNDFYARYPENFLIALSFLFNSLSQEDRDDVTLQNGSNFVKIINKAVTAEKEQGERLAQTYWFLNRPNEEESRRLARERALKDLGIYYTETEANKAPQARVQEY